MSQFRRKLLESYATNKLVYPGLIAAWSAKGKTNEDVDRNVLKDLTGNGHDITLNNFAYSGMSGYGGYATNFTNWTKQIATEVTHNKVIMNSITGVQNWINNTKYPLSNGLKIKVSGITDEKVFYRYSQNSDNLDSINMQLINGINECPSCVNCNFFSTTVKESCNIILELLPEYPDALVFDGVDDYSVNENMSILQDFTLIIKKNDIANPKEGESFYISKSASVGIGAFILGFTNLNSENTYCNLYGNPNYYNYENWPILYVTQNLFNGSVCLKGDLSDSKTLTIGSIRPGDRRMWTGAFYSAYLFDRSLDEQEIKAFIRKYIDSEYLLPSEIPTPDCYYDFSKGSNDDENRETIVDQSGNGNDAVAKGFAWSGMSGYGGYNLPIEGLTIDGTYNGVTRVYGYDIPNGVTLNKLRFNISGLENNIISIRINGLDYSYNISENGYHELKAITNDSGSVKTFEIISTVFTYNNVVIEFLPEYPGALVLDGVDDYISLDSEGFKTIFMVLNNFMVNLNFVYDAREAKGNALGFKSDDSLPYSYTEPSDLLINGNTNVDFPSNYLLNKKHLVSCSDISGIGKIYIGKHYKIDSYFSKMAIYKFLGFKDKLTEEQIQYVIKKYNLLDGVDNIDVN